MRESCFIISVKYWETKNCCKPVEYRYHLFLETFLDASPGTSTVLQNIFDTLSDTVYI